MLSELQTGFGSEGHLAEDKTTAKSTHALMTNSVQYAPWWVRVLSALCLGLGTMIGYKRIVTTLGERLGKEKLVPAQGGSAELAAAAVIGSAGFTGFPVSTTHVVTGGISGTMVGSGAGLQSATLWRIATAWVLTIRHDRVVRRPVLHLVGADGAVGALSSWTRVSSPAPEGQGALVIPVARGYCRAGLS